VLQFGQVDARSQVPRGVDDSTVVSSSVDGGRATLAGTSRVAAVKTEGGNVPRGNFSMIEMANTPL
jgi:hypothetical protein